MTTVARRRISGITLVELMVTMAILAILVTIGYPMYTAQVQKARRADARAGVMEIAMAQEREFAAWGGYSEPTGAITGISANDNDPAPDANSVFNSDLARIGQQYGTYYVFNVDVNKEGTTFTITATPTANQASDTKCATFTLDQSGTKSATDTDLCW